MNQSGIAYAPARSVPEEPATQSAGIAALLMRASRRYPRLGICIVAGERDGETMLITYPKLLEEAQRILGGLRAVSHPSGHAPGAKVALVLERPRDFIPAFWACVLGGYVPCLLTPIRNDPQRWATQLAHVDSLLGRPLLLTTSALRQDLPDDMAAVDLDALRTCAPGEPIAEVAPDDAAVLVLTSGSTGTSKAVVLTHGNILAALAGKVECQRLTDADVTLNWISFDHIAALSEAHLLPLYVGAMQLHADPAAILADPLLFLRLLDRFRVSMTFTPNFLLGQINAALQSEGRTLPGLNLACVRHIICGGEAIVIETAQRFLGLLEPHGLASDALWPAFGMTETCAGSVYSREFPAGEHNQEFASLGLPISGLRMRIADAAGGELAEGESGELQLHGPMVFSRYYNNKEATREAFTEDGWFRTGDTGRLERGRLSLVGRSKDSIIVSGVNYFSHELETALQPLEGIERSFVAAFPTRPKGADTEQLVIAFATSFPQEDESSLYQLTIAVRNTAILLWGFRPSLILPLPKEDFPKTSLGKIQRAIMRRRLESGEFSAHAAHIAAVTSRQMGGYSAPQGAAELAIAAIYAGMFTLDPATVSATANFFDLGGTSLDIITLKQKVEQRTGFADLQMVTILQNPTVRELAARISPESRRQKRDYDPIVPLQITGKKTPLFCVHPGIGEVLVFVNLAKFFINDRPFHALRARGFDAGETHFGSFRELVLTYYHAIRKRQPHGPYALAGYSYGAPVAFEIAKLLESQGERVGFVGSIDMPPSHSHKVDRVSCAVTLAFFLSLITEQQAATLPEKLRSEASAQDPSAALIDLAPPQRLAELDIDLPKFRAWTALTHQLLLVAQPYVPSGSVDSLSVFYAHPPYGTKQDWLNNELKRWDGFSRNAVRYVEVPGEHITLMGPKHVGSFQALLRAEIDRAMGDK